MCNFPPMSIETANITTADVARRYGVLPSTVRRWVERGSLKPTLQTPGGHYRFSEKDLQALAASTEKASA